MEPTVSQPPAVSQPTNFLHDLAALHCGCHTLPDSKQPVDMLLLITVCNLFMASDISGILGIPWHIGTCISCGTAGAAREGIVTYTGLDASQHTQHASLAPLSDPSNKPPSEKPPSNKLPNKPPSNKQAPQAVPQQPLLLAKQSLPAQPPVTHEHAGSLKQHAGRSVGAAADTPRTKGLKHEKPLIEQVGQEVVQADRDGNLEDVPAQLPVRQRQSSPAVVDRQQQAGGKAAAQAANVDHASAFNHCQEGRAPFGLFPSTQQSSSQPGSKLTVPAVQQTRSAAETATLEFAEKAQPQQQQQGQQHQAQQQQGRQHGQQSRQPPSMSPSESSSVRPPQDASRRMSSCHTTPAAGVKGHAGITKQQPLSRADLQGIAAEGRHVEDCNGRVGQAAAAAGGSGGKMSTDAGWKPRRARKLSPAAADSLAVEGQQGAASNCSKGELTHKDASKPGEQICATDHAPAQQAGKSQLATGAALVDRQHGQGNIQQQQQQQQAKSGAAEDVTRAQQQTASVSGG